VVQALAFAEIFLGLILADAGYKGVSISSVVKGEAGETVEPAPLGSTTTTPKTTNTGSTPGATAPAGPQGDTTDESEAEAIAKGELLAPPKALGRGELRSINERFGPLVNNVPPGVLGARP
jgi:hypothetical protein